MKRLLPPFSSRRAPTKPSNLLLNNKPTFFQTHHSIHLLPLVLASVHFYSTKNTPPPPQPQPQPVATDDKGFTNAGIIEKPRNSSSSTLSIKQAEQAFYRLDYEKALEITSQLLEESSMQNGEISRENGPLALLYGRIMFKMGQKQQEERLTKIIAKAKEKQDGMVDVLSDDDEEEMFDEEQDGEEDALEEAWNLLEMSRLCYEHAVQDNANDHESQRNLAEVHILEAQVLAEQDQFDEAVQEYIKCLKYISKDDLRKLSEVHCQIADYSMFSGDVDRAVKYYKEAANTMEKLIKESEDETDKEVLVDLHQRIEEVEKNPNKFKQQPSLENTLQDLNDPEQAQERRAKQEQEAQENNANVPVNVLQPRRQ
eukprot:CAMPEP_0117442632 /NCGR_PEP_ID=MMETSP0759-20121206/4257_1 /TAXON_ID=63605 /ORGANISM="Percolomonas cosmopolitus, Strain WS" /LENGTH=369 /DNA_ID=CAMNT_0005234537 /DNA_START=118 /DNA_END=1227 /DNA_ORIENTATION=-